MQNFKGVAADTSGLFILAIFAVVAFTAFYLLSVQIFGTNLFQIQKNVKVAIDIDEGSRTLIDLMNLEHNDVLIMSSFGNFSEEQKVAMVLHLREALEEGFKVHLTYPGDKITMGHDTNHTNILRLAADVPVPGAGKVLPAGEIELEVW